MAQVLPSGLSKKCLDKTRALGYNGCHIKGIAIPRSARKPARIQSFLDNNYITPR
jgi:hypothetical protein